MKLGPALAIGLAATAALALGLYHLGARYPGTLADRDGRIDFAYYLILGLAAVAYLIVALRTERFGHVVRSALVWGGLGLALLVGYACWEDVAPVAGRVGAHLFPAEPRAMGPGQVSLRADSGGHFQAVAEVAFAGNAGQRVRFLIDTGASDVALSRDDARRLGIDVDRLAYNAPYGTANGTSFGARVRLDRVTVGDVALDDVAAHVAGGDLGQSLLGMSFLRRLGGFEIRGGEMILRR